MGTIALTGGGVLRYSTGGSQTVVQYVAPRSNRKEGMVLGRDATVSPRGPVEIKLIAEVGEHVLVVSDQYESKQGSMSYCGAGQEKFLRVLSIGGAVRETFHAKLESCIDNLELASPGVLWNPETSTLEIHWLSGSGPNEHNQTRSYRIDPRNGDVKASDSPH